METTDNETSNHDNHLAGSDSATNGTIDEKKDGNSNQQPPASQQQTNQHEQKKGEVKKVAGLPLNPSTEGKQTGNQAEKKPSLQTRLAHEQASKQSGSRKKKLIRLTVGGVVLFGIGMYFYHQIQSLVAASTTGLRTPGKLVRMDSTAQKIDPLSTAYEKEAKNRYQDSLHRAIEKDAMGHIVMDWGRLYNVDNYKDDSYDPKRKNSLSSIQPDTASAYGEKSLYDLLSKELGNHQADSLALEQKRLAAIQASNKAAKGTAALGTIATSTARKGSSAQTSTRNRVQPDNALAKSVTRQQAENSLFNVIHGSSASVDARGSNGNSSNGNSSNGNSSNGNSSNGNSSNGNYSSGNYSSGNRSEAITDADAEPVVVRAVVHGNHKVASGSKVAFRLLEGVSFQGMYFEKNTILIGIATFRNGRVNFSDFRSKSLSSVSASHGAVASTALPMVCYDTDMVAGISVSDQSPVETQTRQAGSSALSDAANDASYSIPYGSLARAASSLTRGVASGKRQQREKFIDLADNYPVLLELAITEKIGAEKVPPKAR